MSIFLFKEMQFPCQKGRVEHTWLLEEFWFGTVCQQKCSALPVVPARGVGPWCHTQEGRMALPAALPVVTVPVVTVAVVTVPRQGHGQRAALAGAELGWLWQQGQRCPHT